MGATGVSPGPGTGSIFSSVTRIMERRVLVIQAADDTKLGGVAQALQGRIRIENDQDKAETRSEIYRMNFNKDKCKERHVGRKNQMENGE